jgi:hypothetical protein
MKRFEIRLRVELAAGAEAVTTFTRKAESAERAVELATAAASEKNMRVLETLGIWSK